MSSSTLVRPVACTQAENEPEKLTCRVVVLWIDWYPYHVARFRGLEAAPTLAGKVAGLEFVGGVGVHAGLSFREELPSDLRVDSIVPQGEWHRVSKLMLARNVWRRLALLDAGVVLVPGYYTLPALAAAAWAKIHRRTSVLMTESTAGDHTRSIWKEWAKAFMIRVLFDWAVTGGKAHRRYLDQLGFPASRVVSFYDVVDNRLFRQGAQLLQTHTAEDFKLPERYFLYVGRLAEEKNVSGLMLSWLRYRDRGGRWALVLAGDGPESKALREMVLTSSFRQEVYFAGHLQSRELVPYYTFAKCFILPSTREPWGLVVNEAMASGLPVLVSSRCGCAEDLVEHGQNGFVFDPESGEELTSLLSRIESLGPERLRRMGDCSQAIVASYSPENFGQEIASIADGTPSTSGVDR